MKKLFRLQSREREVYLISVYYQCWKQFFYNKQCNEIFSKCVTSYLSQNFKRKPTKTLIFFGCKFIDLVKYNGFWSGLVTFLILLTRHIEETLCNRNKRFKNQSMKMWSFFFKKHSKINKMCKKQYLQYICHSVFNKIFYITKESNSAQFYISFEKLFKKNYHSFFDWTIIWVEVKVYTLFDFLTQKQ